MIELSSETDQAGFMLGRKTAILTIPLKKPFYTKEVCQPFAFIYTCPLFTGIQSYRLIHIVIFCAAYCVFMFSRNAVYCYHQNAVTFYLTIPAS